MLHRLTVRVGIVIGAPGKANPYPPVGFPVRTVDVFYDVIGDKQIPVVDSDIPLDGVSLQATKMAIRDAHALNTIMESLP